MTFGSFETPSTNHLLDGLSGLLEFPDSILHGHSVVTRGEDAPTVLNHQTYWLKGGHAISGTDKRRRMVRISHILEGMSRWMTH
jgi:hypothetical protein